MSFRLLFRRARATPVNFDVSGETISRKTGARAILDIPPTYRNPIARALITKELR